MQRFVRMLALTLVIASSAWMTNANSAPEMSGFENIPQPMLYCYEQKGSLDHPLVCGYVEPTFADKSDDVVLFHSCADPNVREVKAAILKPYGGVCVTPQAWNVPFPHRNPEDLQIEIYTVWEVEPGGGGAQLKRVISYKDPIENPAGGIGGDTWKAMREQLGGDVPMGTFLGHSISGGDFFLLAPSLNDVRHR